MTASTALTARGARRLITGGHCASIAAAVLALFGVGLLAGCAGGQPRPRSPAAAAFIDLLSTLPRSLDPADQQGPEFDRLETSLAATLVRPLGRSPAAGRLAPAGEMVPFLATSWQRLAGGDYLFALRRGVRSAYGHTLNGADVSFSFRRELALCAAARFLARVAKIALRDPITVLAGDRVRLNVTSASALTLAVLGDFRFAVLDSREVRAHESAADASAHAWLAGHLAFYGAYALTRFDPAERLLLRANPHFWRPLAFTDLAIEAVPSASLRVADLAAAEASHTSGLGWASFAIAARTAGVRTATLPSTAVSTLVPDERFRPFASVLVRRALSLAIDRTAISRAAFAGIAPPALHPLASTLAYAAGVGQPTYGHDVALARALLTRAGYRDGFSIVLATCPGEDSEAEALARQLRAIGIRVRTRSVATAAELARRERDGSVEAVLETSAVPIASAAFAIAADYLRDSPGNLEGYDAPALDALGSALEAGGPAGAARAALVAALSIVGSSYPVIPLVEVPSQEVSLAAIGGYAAYATAAVYYDQLSG